MKDFSHLEYLKDGSNKARRARLAVNKLRKTVESYDEKIAKAMKVRENKKMKFRTN